MQLHHRITALAASSYLLIGLTLPSILTEPQQASAVANDVLIVGAGISGLSAALEAARGGAKVQVLDMASVFGGHAVMSEGGVTMIGTPFQQSLNLQDTPDLAYKDFTEWGEDANPEWVRYYVDNSRTEIYDWLTSLGVKFDIVMPQYGNSVARFHQTKGRGLGLVSPIYRECLKNPNISFVWNLQVTGLITERGRVSGVRGKDLRTGKTQEFRSRAVILATGGFQSNLALVREYWPKSLNFPDRVLVGSGVNSVGSGLEMAKKAGAVLYNLDHQWNYPWGLPDPRYPGSNRGLNARSPRAIWVNAQGKRFVNENTSGKFSLPTLLKQKPATYWAIFDEQTKSLFVVSGSDWGDFKTIQRVIFDNPDLVKTASTIEELAAKVSLPVAPLTQTIQRYNEMVANNNDTDFGRFGPNAPRPILPRPFYKIEKPPFYAVQFFPITRKSMGGVLIDLSCRVVDQQKRPIPGLYAVGELTGLAGINGKAGLEGTFLGPSVITGRVAGRAVVAELKAAKKLKPTVASTITERLVTAANSADNQACSKCHNLETSIAKPRTGYWHFERAHRVILERKYSCNQCHAEMEIPYKPANHRINRLVQINSCVFCHVAE
ncbi:MAG: FAD-dependent oxidoreductase [Blastocatellia bacterium]